MLNESIQHLGCFLFNEIVLVVLHDMSNMIAGNNSN